MPNFNYGKPRGSPTALSLLIAPVSKLCRLYVEQCRPIFMVNVRQWVFGSLPFVCFVPLPMITERGDFFLPGILRRMKKHCCKDGDKREEMKKKKKKERALSAWLHLRCRTQRCILWSLSRHSEGSFIWGAWITMNGWYSREDETPWEGRGKVEPGDEKTGK